MTDCEMLEMAEKMLPHIEAIREIAGGKTLTFNSMPDDDRDYWYMNIDGKNGCELSKFNDTLHLDKLKGYYRVKELMRREGYHPEGGSGKEDPGEPEKTVIGGDFLKGAWV